MIPISSWSYISIGWWLTFISNICCSFTVMKNIVVLENIRSCYNVWNILRTADALGRDIILTGYTPSPFSQSKVKKTSLGAEDSIGITEFFTTSSALEFLKQKNYEIIAAEVTDSAIALSDYQQKKPPLVAVVLWNEVAWVESETLAVVDRVVKIPMVWTKESLNVWQTAAIFMWGLK